jgi:hypothetical protein
VIPLRSLTANPRSVAAARGRTSEGIAPLDLQRQRHRSLLILPDSSCGDACICYSVPGQFRREGAARQTTAIRRHTSTYPKAASLDLECRRAAPWAGRSSPESSYKIGYLFFCSEAPRGSPQRRPSWPNGKG